MLRTLLNYFLVLFFVVAANAAFSADLGQVADNLLEPVSVLSNFIGSASIVLGISFLFAALLKYMQHRISPLEVPISTIVMLVIMGVVLLLLPLAYKLTGSGVP